MSKCFIEGVGGGGSGKLFAAIGVTYTEGAILTCTNGTKTLKAKTTTGQWVFAIPEAGTWTVTAIEDTDTSSATVEITTEGQSVNVDLARFWLYKDGEQYTSVTDGWSIFRAGSVSADKININGGAGYPAGFSSGKAIDFSKYSTLYAVCDIQDGQKGGPSVVKFGITGARITGENPSFAAASSNWQKGTQTLTCDISHINSGYVSMYSQYHFNRDTFQIWAK